MVVPHDWAVSQALLTRPPLDTSGASSLVFPLDLHVLGLPPAFNLSHDQTLQLKFDFLRSLERLNEFTVISSNFLLGVNIFIKYF